jgi:arylsulfatase A-like enzyme
LRKDYFDDYFDWLPGIKYEHAWTTAQYTIPAHASLLTGLYPSEHGAHSKSELLDCDRDLITEQLSEVGYTTRAITSNVLMSPLFGFDRGIDEFYFSGRAQTLNDDIYPWQEGVASSLKRGISRDLRLILDCVSSEYDTLRSLKFGLRLKRDRFNGIEDTIKTISNIDFDSNEFLLINTMEAHGPYEPPDEYRTTDYESKYIESRIQITDSDDLSNEQAAYRDSVRYLSDRYQVLFDKLSEDFDFIITLADHGELFGEYETSRHYYGVPPELVNIPLSIYAGSESPDNQRVTQPTSILDVHKTVLEAANIDHVSRGHDLLDDDYGEEYLVESLGIRAPLFDRLQNAEFNDEFLNQIDQPLRGIALPNQYYGFETPEGNFVESGETSIDSAQERLQEIVASWNSRINMAESAEKDFTAGVESQLESLGYL